MHSSRPHKDIRQQLKEKRQALNTELAKQTPDAATARSPSKGRLRSAGPI